MKTRNSILALAIVVCTLTCCVQEDPIYTPSFSKVSFEAVHGDAPTSKTFLYTDGTVFWSPNDSITLFYGDNKSTKLISDNVTPAIQTTFNGTLEGFEPNGTDEFWAIYPYSPDNTFDGSAVTFTLSGEQYWSGDFVCIAHSKDYTLQFYNVCGGVKFSVDRRGIQYVTFRGNNNEVLAGTVQATFDDSERPVVSDILEGETELCLYAPDGGFEVGQWYYMASLPATLSAGYTITFYKNQEVVSERTVDTPVTIKRSALGRLTSADNRDGLLVVNNYLTFESEGTTTISMYNYSGDRPVLYVSTDKTHWTLWDQNEITFDSNAPLYMCGDNPEGINPGNNTTVFVSSGDLFSIHGSIMSLLDMETELTVIPTDYCFYALFYNCQQLVEGPSLPATTLTDGCYREMFHGCTSLTTAPDLPATELANYCYSWMFNNCTGLIAAPDILPSSTMAEDCCYGMFMYCTNLTNAPELPATTLADRCYAGMFYNCTSLTTAPDLPATELADSCYTWMFAECESLIKSPDLLPATELAKDCYSVMFRGCSSLTTAPELPATTLAEGCYSIMFSNCTSLSVAPALPATSIPSRAYYAMFHNCTNLTTAPELPATELAYRSYAWMFEECHNLTTAPDILPATTMDEECYRGMFFRCSSLTNTPQLPALVMAKGCYMSMFYECSSLVEAPELPATTLAEDCYRSMFWNSPGLKSASSLPATTLVEDCYSGMFSYCTSLEDVPELPATVLVDSCYYRMFDGCTSLEKVTCLATDISANGCVDYWLGGVASQGTFIKSGLMNDWPQGSSGIPEGWSVENAGEMSIADVYDAEDGATVYLDNVLVYAVSTVSFVVGDDSAESFVNIYHAGTLPVSVSQGDRVSVSGKMLTYAGVPEVKSIDGLVVNSSNNPLGEPEYIDYEIIKNGQYNKVTPVIATGLSVQRGNDSSHYFFLFTWENIAERQSPPVFLYWTTPQFDQFSDQYLAVSGFWLFRDSSSPLVQDRLDNILIDAVEPADAPYQTASILDVLNGSDGEYYKVTGTISQVANTNYGNVYLTDDSTQQTLYIYGMKNMIGSYPKDVDPDAIGFWETFPSLSENMVITVLGVRSTYNNTIELVDATLIYSATQ